MNKKEVEKNLTILTLVIMIIFSAIFFQLINLQIIQSEDFRRLSEGNRIRLVPITASRGVFNDRYGRVIVTNRPGFTVSYFDIEKDRVQQEMVFEKLRSILDIPKYTIVEREKHTVNERGSFRLNKRPLADNQENSTIDLYVYDKNGSRIILNSFNKNSGWINVDLTPGSEIYATYYFDTIRNKINEQGFRKYMPVRLKTDVEFEKIARIEEQRLPGIVIEIEPIREYPYGEMASHVFGYLGEINAAELKILREQGYRAGDFIGKSGLERELESHLRGEDGGQQVEVTATGELISVMGRQEPISGNTAFLTLDIELQQTAEKALKEAMSRLQNHPTNPYPNAKKGSVVVMNVKTGEILAMVSEPGFNPNLFASRISRKDWDELVNNPLEPLYNKAISGIYPPGSVFKMVTSAAALEEEVTNIHERINTQGGVYWTIAPKRCWAAYRGGHGIVDINDSIAKSCNIFFYEMGRRLGIDTLEEYTRMFGFGDLTGIDLPREQAGIVAGRSYKEAAFTSSENKRWYPAETLDAAIGQGYHSQTPIQVARYISSIANDGKLVKPYIVEKVVKADGEVVFEGEHEYEEIDISLETLQIIQKGMRDAAKIGGTAAGTFWNFPIEVAAKTGTAEWDQRYQSHAWFSAYAPYENPEIAIVAMIEQGGSGSTIGPIAKSIFEKHFGLHDQEIKDFFEQP